MSQDAPPRGAVDPREVDALLARFGPAEQRHAELPMGEERFAFWHDKVQGSVADRRAEVALAVERPDGRLLLHTKSFYPAGVMRIPTGGIGPEESVLDALRREAHEETGLEVEIARWLGLVTYRFRQGPRALPFATYLFHVRVGMDPPRALDEEERISELRYVPARAIEAVLDDLLALPPSWADWGRFRALPHELLLDRWREPGAGKG